MALRNLGLDYETVAISEIDKHAITSYNAIHGVTPNLGDITRVERLPDECNLVTYSFPCQDLSPLNRDGKGLAGSRSGLLAEVGRLLDVQRERERELTIGVNHGKRGRNFA